MPSQSKIYTRDSLYLASLYERYGWVNEAMFKLTKTIHKMTPHPDYIHDPDFAKYLRFGDTLCERVAERFIINGSKKYVDNDSVAIITSRMYLSGGHTSLINDFADALSSYKVTVYITGYWEGDTNLEELKIKYPSLHQVQYVKIDAGSKDFGSSCWGLVQHLVHQMPAEVYLFQHPFDALAIAGAVAYKKSAEISIGNGGNGGGEDSAESESSLTPRFYFYHHADIRPTLGVNLDGFNYLAHKKSMVGEQKENKKGFSYHMPLTAPVVFQDLTYREKNYSNLFEEGQTNTLSIGQHLKFFPDFSSNVSYANAVAVLLERVDGKHVHIGPLANTELLIIQESLYASGIDFNRFVHIPFIYSLSLFLNENDITFFLSSFPIGGGLSVLEAMSNGLIILPFSHTNGAFSEQAFLPRKTPSWATKQELAKLVESYLKARSLKTKRKKFADHFSKYYSREKFIGSLEIAREKSKSDNKQTRKIEKTPEEVDYLVSIIDAVSLGEVGATTRSEIAQKIRDEASIGTESPTIYFDDDYFRLFFLEDMAYWNDPILYYVRFGKDREWNPHPLIDAKWMKETQGLTDEETALSFFLFNSLEVEIQPHPIFDRSHYWDCSPDVESHLLEPMKHFLMHGFKEIPREFFFLFDRKHFLIQKGSSSGKIPDLLQFLFEHDFDLSPHILFSEKYYREQAKLHPDQNAFEHYIRLGINQRFDPHPLISIDYLAGKYRRKMDSKKRIHNFLYEWRNVNQLMNPHPYFDADYYVENDVTLRSEVLHPISHYLREGEKGNRKPHPNFSPKFYWDKYYPIVNTNSNLEHFVLDGFAIGRQQTVHGTSLKPYHLTLLKKALNEGDSENAVAIWETKIGTRPSVEFDNPETVQAAVKVASLKSDEKKFSIISATKHQAEHVFNKPSQLGWMDDVFQTRKMVENQVAVSKIMNIKIIGGSYGLYDANGFVFHPLLCDYDLDQIDLRETSPIKFATKDKALISLVDYRCVKIGKGIHLSSDGEMRANSWAIDILPKLIYLFSLGALDDEEARLIVDHDVPFQCVEAIRLFTDLPIKNVRKNYVYGVKELTYVSPIVESRPFVKEEDDDDRFFTFNGTILLQARQLFSERLKVEPDKYSGEKVILVRHPERKLGNWGDFKRLMSSAGYEVIDLAQTSLHDLNLILKSAKSVITFENECVGVALMLTNPKTKLFIIRGESSYNNIYHWSNLGDLMDVSVHFLSIKESESLGRERGDEFYGRGYISSADCRNIINL